MSHNSFHFLSPTYILTWTLHDYNDLTQSQLTDQKPQSLSLPLSKTTLVPHAMGINQQMYVGSKQMCFVPARLVEGVSHEQNTL